MGQSSHISSAYDAGLRFSIDLMKPTRRTRVLFVCMGNICRSPTAEAVFRQAVQEAGLADAIECDSAGTHDYHIGEPPDHRAQHAAARRGYDMSHLRGRQVSRRDFDAFDLVVAMDRRNLSALEALCPPECRDKLVLYCDLHDEFTGREVPDPYYGGAHGFEQVLDLTEKVSESLLARIGRMRRA